MKRWLTILLLVGVSMGLAACRRQDLRRAVIHVPAMQDQEVAFEVRRALSQTAGVLTETVEIDKDRRLVRLTYESLVTGLKNLEFAISEAGYQANTVPPNAIDRE